MVKYFLIGFLLGLAYFFWIAQPRDGGAPPVRVWRPAELTRNDPKRTSAKIIIRRK